MHLALCVYALRLPCPFAEKDNPDGLKHNLEVQKDGHILDVVKIVFQLA